MEIVTTSAVAAASFHLEMEAGEAFPLFSPRGEEIWVPGWAPEMLWPPDGAWVEGQVFRTNHAGEAIWFVASLDHDALRVAYDRVDLGKAAVRITVRCVPAGAKETHVFVEYRTTALNPDAVDGIAQQTDEALRERLAQWRGWIEGSRRAY